MDRGSRYSFSSPIAREYVRKLGIRHRRTTLERYLRKANRRKITMLNHRNSNYLHLGKKLAE
jgi:hypothetical protein